MDPRVIALHDEALQLQPERASHDRSLCPICVDWSLDESGVPSCFDRLDEADKQAPFGDVEYADPGFLEGGVKRYPLDTESHVQAVAALLDREDVAGRYSSDELKQMRQRTNAALERIGAESQEAASDQQVEEGGSTPVTDTIAQETHEALLHKAVEDATSEAQAEIARLQEQVNSLTEERDTAQARADELEQANEQVNSELDQAQVQLRSAQEERDQLKADIAKRDEEAQFSELANQRAEQVRNLGLFPDDYIKEKARAWAEIPEDDWADRVEEWKQAKGTTESSGSGGSDDQLPHEQASAMSGSTEGSGKNGKASSPRRAVLGLE